ncbi:MAG: phage holin family protein [Sphingobacteriales bacterium]|nr:phage holin family protein [Sphingobacteriales bacterium]
MSEEFGKIESLLDKAKEYINTRIAQVKLSVAEKISKTLSVIIAAFVAVLVFLFFLLFGSIALAIVIGNLVGKLWLGFLIIAVAWLLSGILIWKTKERLLQIPIMNAILKAFSGGKGDNEED